MLRLIHGRVKTCSEFERKKRPPHVEIRPGPAYVKYAMAIWTRIKVV
jgi:hypothetical protein